MVQHAVGVYKLLENQRANGSFVDEQPCIGFSSSFLNLLHSGLGDRVFVAVYDGKE